MEQPTVTTHPTVVVVECVSVTWLVREGMKSSQMVKRSDKSYHASLLEKPSSYHLSSSSINEQNTTRP